MAEDKIIIRQLIWAADRCNKLLVARVEVELLYLKRSEWFIATRPATYFTTHQKIRLFSSVSEWRTAGRSKLDDEIAKRSRESRGNTDFPRRRNTKATAQRDNVWSWTWISRLTEYNDRNGIVRWRLLPSIRISALALAVSGPNTQSNREDLRPELLP